jgi:hypothetical protein
VRLFLGTLIAFAIAAALGLAATFAVVTRGAPFGAITIGVWSASPRAGTEDIDPYARAAIARSGELPTGSGDGLAFTARADDAGRPLDGRCEVVLNGTTPPARYWTITIYDAQGQLIANSIARQGFTSQEIVRGGAGTFEIVVGPRPRSGNWLPTSGTERYILVLRLYDTPVGVTTRNAREAQMPTIVQRACA